MPNPWDKGSVILMQMAGFQAPIRDFAESVERVEAAVDAVRQLPIPFTLTARAENFLYGIQDLDHAIAYPALKQIINETKLSMKSNYQ